MSVPVRTAWGCSLPALGTRQSTRVPRKKGLINQPYFEHLKACSLYEVYYDVEFFCMLPGLTWFEISSRNNCSFLSLLWQLYFHHTRWSFGSFDQKTISSTSWMNYFIRYLQLLLKWLKPCRNRCFSGIVCAYREIEYIQLSILHSWWQICQRHSIRYKAQYLQPWSDPVIPKSFNKDHWIASLVNRILLGVKRTECGR